VNANGGLTAIVAAFGRAATRHRFFSIGFCVIGIAMNSVVGALCLASHMWSQGILCFLWAGTSLICCLVLRSARRRSDEGSACLALARSTLERAEGMLRSIHSELARLPERSE
jgi:hypothetical protein